MLIQINTDHNITVHDAYNDKLTDLLIDELKRFSTHITRLELHLSDENGPKKGVKDKKCSLEARLAGRKPLGVSDLADTYDLAVKGAIDKMKKVLDTTLSKQ